MASTNSNTPKRSPIVLASGALSAMNTITVSSEAKLSYQTVTNLAPTTPRYKTAAPTTTRYSAALAQGQWTAYPPAKKQRQRSPSPASSESSTSSENTITPAAGPLTTAHDLFGCREDCQKCKPRLILPPSASSPASTNSSSTTSIDSLASTNTSSSTLTASSIYSTPSATPSHTASTTKATPNAAITIPEAAKHYRRPQPYDNLLMKVADHNPYIILERANKKHLCATYRQRCVRALLTETLNTLNSTRRDANSWADKVFTFEDDVLDANGEKKVGMDVDGVWRARRRGQGVLEGTCIPVAALPRVRLTRNEREERSRERERLAREWGKDGCWESWGK